MRVAQKDMARLPEMLKAVPPEDVARMQVGCKLAVCSLGLVSCWQHRLAGSCCLQASTHTFALVDAGQHPQGVAPASVDKLPPIWKSGEGAHTTTAGRSLGRGAHSSWRHGHCAGRTDSCMGCGHWLRETASCSAIQPALSRSRCHLHQLSLPSNPIHCTVQGAAVIDFDQDDAFSTIIQVCCAAHVASNGTCTLVAPCGSARPGVHHSFSLCQRALSHQPANHHMSVQWLYARLDELGAHAPAGASSRGRTMEAADQQ